MEKVNTPNEAAPKEEQSKGERILFVGGKWAIVGGLFAAAIVVAGRLVVGQIYSSAEARSLLDALLPSARSVGMAVVAASATILALMLTMLGLTRHATSRLERLFYRRVERIGLLSTISLSGGILLLMFLSIPVEQSKNLPEAWFSYVYYVLIVLTAALAGLLVAIVLMLYNAMQSLIQVLSPSDTGSGTTKPEESRPGESQR